MLKDLRQQISIVEEELIHITPRHRYLKIRHDRQLRPFRRLTLKEEELAHRTVYFILKRDLEKWLRWPFFVKWLIHHISEGGRFNNLALIRIPLRKLPKEVKGNMFVVDRWAFQVSRMQGPFFGDPLFRHVYPYSIVPLSDYLQQKTLRGVFQLPEVVSFTRVPLVDEHTVHYVRTKRVLDVLKRLTKK